MENENVIVGKIQKLLSLAKSDNEKESELAYKKAMELMIKHNIESVPEKRNYEKEMRAVRRETVEIKAVNQILVNCFFVKIVRGRKFDSSLGEIVRTYRYYGEKANLDIALYALDYLQKVFKEQWQIKRKLHEWSVNYKQAFYSGLINGFTKSYTDRKNYVENQFAMVLVDDPRLTEFLKEDLGEKVRSKNQNFNNRSGEAMKVGSDVGEKIKIAKAVESSVGFRNNLIGV